MDITNDMRAALGRVSECGNDGVVIVHQDSRQYVYSTLCHAGLIEATEVHFALIHGGPARRTIARYVITNAGKDMLRQANDR